MTESVKSFTSKKPPVVFDVDGETFTAYSVLPADIFGEFASKVLLLPARRPRANLGLVAVTR